MSKKKNKKKNNSSTPKKEVKVEVKLEEKIVEEQKEEVRLCPKCSMPAPRKFCANCGAEVEKELVKEKEESNKEESIRTCPKCSTPVIGKFCSNCGENVEIVENPPIETEEVVEDKKEELKVCPKCSTVVTRKYCPNCGENVENITLVEEKKEVIIESPTVESSAPITPPVNSIGIPGIVPIPNAGMDHNAIKQYNFTDNHLEEQVTEKKKNRVVIIIFIIMIIIVIALSTLCIILLKDKKKNKIVEPSNSSTNINSNSNKESNTNTNEEKPADTVKLSCTLKNEYMDGITAISKSTYTFQNDKIIKAIDEEILEFDEKGMQYYDIYLNQVKEELTDDSYTFDNTSLEMIKTENSVGLSYTIDLTVDPKNPNNNMDLLGTTYKGAKKELELEGYKCE